jgi:hypothetical protein
MNERIRELAVRADKIVKSQHPNADMNTGVVILMDVFAELIVRECADYMYTNYPNSRYEVNYMRKHMGDPDWNKTIGVEE